MPKLIAEDGKLKGLVLALDQGEEWLIGRDPDTCQFLIEDPLVSRHHAIFKQTNHVVTLENLSETNPIKINDEQIDGPQTLKEGDEVKIGGTNFRFYNKEEVTMPVNEDQNNQNSLAYEDYSYVFDAVISKKTFDVMFL